jgi:integrase
MLTVTEIRAVKPQDKPRKLSDGGGLYLLINPNGSLWWRLKYRFDGREKLLSLGVYPHVSLQQARSRREDAKRAIASGVDPSAKRQAEKSGAANTFESIAREWLALQQKKLAPATYDKAVWTFETLLFPYIGSRPVAKLGAVDVLKVLRRIEVRGHHETAHRARQRCAQVFRYAVQTERADRDVTTDLRGALAPVVTEHHASITDPARIGELLRAIDGYSGHVVTAQALRLAPLVFVRPGELRHAEWSEFDLDGQEPVWRIPAEKMKMREQHVVPLAKQALALLRELRALTGRGRYVFPSLRSGSRPMSDNTVNAALRRLGYTSDEMTGHGFRSLASTSLNEQGYHPDLIELQLAHAERNQVRAAYNKAQRLPERRKMMEAWADYLDGLRDGANVLGTLCRTRDHSAIGDTPFASAGPELHDIDCHGPGGSQRTGRSTDVAAASATGIKKNTKSRATRLKSSASAASPIRRTNALH